VAGLSDTLTQYRTKLTAEGFSNLPANIDIDDLPASNLHRTYKLSIENFGQLGNIHAGGSLVEYFSEIKLEVYWDPEFDTEAIWNTIGTDVENLSKVMIKASNRNSGSILVTPSARFTFQESPNRIKATATFELRERLTQDVT